MTQVVLHIGDGKCGSSAIQSSLLQAGDALQQMGVYYPLSEGIHNHFFMAAFAGTPAKFPLPPPGKLEAMVDAIKTAAARSGPDDTIVLSGESMFLKKPAALRDAVTRLVPQMRALHVIAYVRKPTEMYLSLVQQRLKSSHWFQKPEKYTRPIQRPVKVWKALGLADTLQVRRFARGDLEGEDAVTDFAACLARITGFAVPLQPVRENTSLSLEQCIVLQRLRTTMLQNEARGFHP
ncbi:MAG: hypothetical protein AAGF56_10930, partial [Pseudomonadota bacterium]